MSDITAELNYSIGTGVKPIKESYGPGNVQSRNTGAMEARAVRIRDGRPLAGQLALERNGFVLLEHATRVADIFEAASYNPAHAWFYFPELRPDEAIVFKVYDSEKDGRARFTPHSAFHDPTTPPDAPPRESIEARAFAFFGPS